MNKRYILTSTSWKGEIILEYSDEVLEQKDNMLLTFLDMRKAMLNEKQMIYFLTYIPVDYSRFQKLIKVNANVSAVEDVEEITFEAFWKKYPQPDGDTKKAKTAEFWNRMSKTDQINAYRYIDRYVNSLPAWQGIMHTNTYLHSKIWIK